MSLLARVLEDRRDGFALAAIEGEVDASNAGEIGERLRGLLSNRDTSLVVDLSDTSYLDSAGINLLFELSSELTARQQSLRLVLPPDSPMLRMFAIVGLSDAIPTHETRAAALAEPA